MAGDETVFVTCLSVLRCLGLCFTRIRRSPRGDLVAEASKVHLVVNVAIAGSFLFAFTQIDTTAFSQVAAAYKSSTIVYPLYTKLMILAIVAFSICGNVYNRKFVDVINLFVRVAEELERDFGPFGGERRKKDGRKVLFGYCAYMGLMTAFNLWTDFHLVVRYQRVFRVVHYFCFYYVTIFTAHFVITMNYARGKFREVNVAFGRMVAPGGLQGRKRRRLEAWMAASVELREAEGMINEVFGKQVCLNLFLAFSSVIVNSYYLITLNLYRTSTQWLNLTMWVGCFQSVAVALTNTRAAESAANEANKINEIIFNFPVHVDNWQMFNKVKYFGLFSHCHPVQFKAWIFYTIDYDSLLKVMLTSSAVTAVILQCDFLETSINV